MNYFRNYLRQRPVFLSLIRGKEAELFQDVLPLPTPILDYGCGDGFFIKTAFVERQGKIDVGIDIDRNVLEKAKKSEVYKKVVCHNSYTLPFKNNYFNSIVSNCVLEHVENLERDLGELFRILKPGGIFVCTVMTNKWEGYLFGKHFFGKYYKTWMKKKQIHVQLPSYKDWERIFKRSGLVVTEKVGYMDENASKWLDILHYVSAYSLIIKLLFGKWVLFPGMFDYLSVSSWMEKITKDKVPLSKSSAVLFVLEKPI